LRVKPEVAPWVGHRSETSAALLKVLIRAKSGQTAISFSERAFATACEFWAAAAAECLTDHLQHAPLFKLRQAHLAFCALGADKTAGLIDNVAALFADAPASLERRTAIQRLERQVRHSEPIDQMLSSYVSSLRTQSGPVFSRPSAV
jgi:hypothetical protein